MLNEPNSAKDFGWLVEHRSENQQLALRLYKILTDQKDILDLLAADESKPEDYRLVTIAGFLVSIIFSLWRAVFICPPDYYRDETLTSAKKFLANLIEDNTIGYTQEKEHQHWTVSYYLNNAALRLQALMYNYGFITDDVFSMQKLRDIWHERQAAWCLCHKAAKAAVDKLETELAAEAQRRFARTPAP